MAGLRRLLGIPRVKNPVPTWYPDFLYLVPILIGFGANIPTTYATEVVKFT